MHVGRKLLAGAVAVVMMLGGTTSALAASYTVGNYDDLKAAIENTGDTDSQVTITVTNDINISGNEIVTKDNTTYTISGATGGSYTLNGSSFSGNGTLNINTGLKDGVYVEGTTITVNGDIEGGVTATDNANVTVNGDITADSSSGVYAENSTVSVTGDITSSDNGVDAHGSTVTVKGDITSSEDDGVYAYDSTVTVEGDIDADEDGVYAGGDSTVTVTGDITAGDDGVEADGSEVTVTGNIDADEDGVNVEDSEVTVTGDIDADDDGVYADDGSTVTVTGDITAGYWGVRAKDGSTVTVTGDIDADDDGVDAEDNSNVTVNGDITAGEYGVDAEDSTVTVTGDITADEYGVHADDSTVTVIGDIEAENNGVYADDSTVTVNGSVTGGDGDPDEVDFDDPDDYSDGRAGVYAENSNVTVTGNVTGGKGYGTYGDGGDAVYARDGSTVTVGGNATGGSVTANPETESTGSTSSGGYGVNMKDDCVVYIGGNVTGGNTNGDQGRGGEGVYIAFGYVDVEEGDTMGSLTVVGSVTGGTAANGEDGAGLYLYDALYYTSSQSFEDCLEFLVKVGAVSNIDGDFDEDDMKALVEEIVQVVGLPVVVDFFWYQVCRQIKDAQPGDTITVDAGWRTVMPAFVMDALRDADVTLVIQWNGGEDIVIDQPYDGEKVYSVFRLDELAELLSK